MRARIGPLWPYLVLIAVPAGGFIVPDLLGGHLLLTGDNAQQNYPLHVLVGSMLRHGQLPFWNPYIFSGSPLLADFNAGAFYPLMLLFVVLPDRAAWIATEVVLYAGTAIGMYVLLRSLALRTVACVAAAATFAFSGVVLSQVNHVDMAEGFVALPWLLLSVVQIARGGRWRWSVVLGVSLAVVILGGAPEAMLDEALFVIGFTVFTAGLDRARWWRLLSRMSAGAVLGLCLASIEWLPGLEAISHSQRAAFGGSFAAAGSYPPLDLFLGVVPYLYGGYHAMGEIGFFSHYNLPEVGIYIGILPVIALLTLVHPRWPSALSGRDRLTWYLAGAFALLLALGSNTPLEHLFNQIPLYGHQRLQSRNMIGVSAAACVLFGGWLDRRPDAAHELATYDRVVGFMPAALAGVLSVWAVADPNSLISGLAGASTTPARVSTVREASLVALGFCLVAAGIVLARRRLGLSAWSMVVGAFVLVDLGVMAGTSQLMTTPPNPVISGTDPLAIYLHHHLSVGGRFEIYDPASYAIAAPGTTPYPDDNVLAGLPSVGGYASIVNNSYNELTETHSQGDLNVAALGRGELDELDLQYLVTVPQYFMTPVGSVVPSGVGAAQPTVEGFKSDPVLPLGYHRGFSDRAYPALTPPRPALAAGHDQSWYFGESMSPAGASLLLTSPSGGATVRFGVLTTAGVRWAPSVRVPAGSSRVSGPVPAGDAAGLAVQVLRGGLPRYQALVTEAGRVYELDGSLSSVVRPGGWAYRATEEGFAVFEQAIPAEVHTVTAAGAPGPAVRVVSSDTKSEVVRVRTDAPLSVYRDVAWDSGWRARISVDGAPARAVPVRQSRLVQLVRVPAGTDVITFTYRPPHLLAATVLSLGALAGLLALGAGSLLMRRERVRRWATRRFSRTGAPA